MARALSWAGWLVLHLRWPAQGRGRASWRQRPAALLWLAVDYLLAVVAVAVTTVLIGFIRQFYDVTTVVMLYLLPVLGLAATRGSGPALVASALGVLMFNYFIAEPVYSFTVADVDETLAVLLLFVTALITGQMAGALRLRAEQASRREAVLEVLYDITRTISAEADVGHLLELITRRVTEAFAASGCAVYLPDAVGQLAVHTSFGAAPPLDWSPAAQSADASSGRPGRRGPPAAPPQQRVGDINVHCVSLKGHEAATGSLCVTLGPHEALGREASWLLTTIAEQVGLAIERQQLQRDAVRAEVLQRTDELKSALLASVSHDLRTPLASIKAAATSLTQRDIDWDDRFAQEFAQMIVQESDRLDRLVENLLNLSRIEAGVLQPSKELHSLTALAYDVLGRMARLTASHRVRVDVPDDLPPVALDYVQVGQVLSNLLENAAKYSAPDTEICLSARVVREDAELSVADQGAGVPPSELGRIFQRFYRLSNGRQGGAGIGLATCKGIVEAHGGRIWAESAGPGRGATVRFTLPMASATGTKADGHSADRKLVGEAAT